MVYADLHTHTHHSFDSEADLRENCRAARAAGLSALAVTNHFDFDGILDGIYPSFLPHLDRAEIEQVRPEFPDLRILFGIEMGQVHAYSHIMPRLLEAHHFDYVLASIHNLVGHIDFSLMRFDVMSEMHCCQLLDRYFREVEQMIRVPGITTLAHLTYPLRYMKKFGKDIDIFRYEAAMRRIFHILIETGIHLEVNSSGLRQGVGATLPSYDVVALYRDCGGKQVAVGSDSHFPEHIGAGVVEVTDRLREMGMEVYLG